jgi:uncharacterized MAPEG superfamily protein
MTNSLWALLTFAGWTLLLAIAVVIYRVQLMRKLGFRINKFPSGLPHGPDRYWRLNRAHVNALESLPVFAAIVLVGKLSGVKPEYFETLAVIVPCARVVQTAFHVAANTAWSVTGRFLAFLTQWLAMAAMILEIVRAAS